MPAMGHQSLIRVLDKSVFYNCPTIEQELKERTMSPRKGKSREWNDIKDENYGVDETET